jgi:hypothetical protein
MRIRLLGLFLSVIGLIGAAVPAHAAGPMTFDDPSGDAIDGQASMDIVGVTYKMGKTRTGAAQFEISMKLAGPPSLQLASYSVWGATSDDPTCERFEVDFRPGTIWSAALDTSPFELWAADCKAEDAVNGNVDLSYIGGEIKGSTITWFVPADSIQKKARATGRISKIRAWTSTVEPLFGEDGNATILEMPTDTAETPKVFSYA